MAERETSGLDLRDEPRAQRGRYRVDHACGQSVEHAAHGGGGEFSSEDRAARERRRRLGRKPPHAIEDHLSHGLRELGERSGRLERPRALDHEQRSASGDLREARHRLRRKRAAANPRGDDADLVRGQRRQSKVDAVTRHPSEPLQRALVEPGILRARRRDDEHAQIAHGLREEREEVERQEIGGVQVFQDPQRRLVRSREALDDLLPESKGAALLSQVRAVRIDAEPAKRRPNRKVRRCVGELPRAPPDDIRILPCPPPRRSRSRWCSCRCRRRPTRRRAVLALRPRERARPEARSWPRLGLRDSPPSPRSREAEAISETF